MAYSDRSSIYQDDVYIIKDRLTFKDKLNNLFLFIWNSERKELFGRDAESWARISLFYCCFYMALAGLFACMVAVFMAIIDKRMPTYHSQYGVMGRQAIDGRIVGVSPGLGFRPMRDVDSTLVRVKSSEKNVDHPYNYQQYVDYLNDFLKFYVVSDKRGEQFINCDHNSDPVELEKQFELNKVCRFEIVEMFGPNNMCSKERNFEFDKAKPCMLIKLNKIYGWMPEAYGPDDALPRELQPYEAIVRKYPRNVFVLCEGEFQVDLDFIGHIRYFSRTQDGSGESQLGFIPFYYFPFRNQDGYRSPLVFAYFHNITTNVLINVVCKAYAKNIYRNNVYRMGSVHFEIVIE